MSVEELLQQGGRRWMTRAASESPDDVLVVAAILGDLAAFDQLVLRYRAAVVRVAQGVVGREHAEDVAQDALLLAFKALPSIEDPRKFPAWLSAITRHRADPVRKA
jgi:RNA polymerase sigma-70 factor (ECF subfamily)